MNTTCSFFVDEANLRKQGCLVVDVLCLALLNGVLGVTELMGAKRDLERLGDVLDRRDLLEGFSEPLGHKPVEGLLLDGDQVGELHDLRDATEVDPLAIRARGDGSDFEISHQALPPSG